MPEDQLNALPPDVRQMAIASANQVMNSGGMPNPTMMQGPNGTMMAAGMNPMMHGMDGMGMNMGNMPMGQMGPGMNQMGPGMNQMGMQGGIPIGQMGGMNPMGMQGGPGEMGLMQGGQQIPEGQGQVGPHGGDGHFAGQVAQGMGGEYGMQVRGKRAQVPLSWC